MTAAASAAEAVATADIVVTMLPSSPHVESVYTGDGGVLAAARKGTLCVDMSTIDPAVSRRVGGGRASAACASWTRRSRAASRGPPTAPSPSWWAARREDFKEARPALAAMGANVIHVGAVGSGEVVKLCNNLIAGVAAVAVSEAFRIAEGFGVDPKVVTEVISKSSGNTFVMEHMHPVPGMVERAASSNDYKAGFMTDLMCKDLGLAVDAARGLRMPSSWRPRPSRSIAWPPPTASGGRISRACTPCSSRPRIRRRSRSRRGLDGPLRVPAAQSSGGFACPGWPPYTLREMTAAVGVSDLSGRE